jgi:hypothetical protein
MLIIKTSDEKRTNPKNAKGLITKTFDEKRGNPKKCKGAHKKRPLRKKEAFQKSPTNTHVNRSQLRQPNSGRRGWLFLV